MAPRLNIIIGSTRPGRVAEHGTLVRRICARAWTFVPVLVDLADFTCRSTTSNHPRLDNMRTSTPAVERQRRVPTPMCS